MLLRQLMGINGRKRTYFPDPKIMTMMSGRGLGYLGIYSRKYISVRYAITPQ